MRKTKHHRRGPAPLQVEPVILDERDLRQRLMTFMGVTEKAVEQVIPALRGLGLRVVQMCGLCAEQSPDGSIPACPNVASVVMNHTRNGGLWGGRFAICLPHSHGEKVWVPVDRARTHRRRPS